MATFRAVGAFTKAIVKILERAWPAADAGDVSIQVYTAKDFEALPEGPGEGANTNVISVIVYRLGYSGTIRVAPGRVTRDGQERPRLPLEARFMLTAWADTADMQLFMAGWAMRVLADNPVLVATDLNRGESGIFEQDEVVEVSPDELATEDLLRLWEGLGTRKYQLSIPYRARTILVDSLRPAEPAPPRVVHRTFAVGVPEGGGPIG